MAILRALQQTVEKLHDVILDVDVTAYVVDDAGRRGLPGARESLPEQLFVREASDQALELALYVAPGIVAVLEEDDPHQHLHGGNLESFCIALEGVSHFVYIAWRASMGWPVTALEMEIQAEVDKFVAAWLLLHEQGFGTVRQAVALQRQLFESYALRWELSHEEADRYHTANRVAYAFSRRLIKEWGDTASASTMMQGARSFCRQSLTQKLRSA